MANNVKIGLTLGAVTVLLLTIAFDAGAATSSNDVSSGTWSIVAVDVDAGEIGVALATCVRVGFSLQAAPVAGSLDDTERMLYRVWTDNGQIELARLLPGHGVIVAQAAVDPENAERLDRAAASLLAGASAQDVIASATSTSVDPSFQTRQYGVAALLHEAASFTGSETDAWSGAASDQFASVQGNILVGPEVVAKGLEAFQQTAKLPDSSLSDRLVTALEAGSMQGGDERCPREQTALTAFVAVARSSDQGDELSLWLTVPVQRVGEQNPVTLLRQAYDEGESSPVEANGMSSDGPHPALWGLAALTLPLAGIVFWLAKRRSQRRGHRLPER